MAFDPRVEDALAQASQRYGVPVEQLRTIAQIESGGNPAAQNPNSSAGGLFQFIDSTAKNYGLKDKYDPYQSADAGARLLKDNAAGLAPVLGRAPTTGELYLAHQQGLGGARKLLSNPNASAASLVGRDAVRLNAGSADMTAQQFANKWIGKADNLAPAVANAGVAGLANQGAQAAQGISAALPTLGATGVGTPPPVTTAASDPMAGVFGMLMQQRMQQAQPVAAAPMARPKVVDNRTEEERLASVSQTPDFYLKRAAMRRTS